MKLFFKLGLWALLLCATAAHAQQYEVTCPAGTSVLNTAEGVTFDSVTGKFRQNICLDAAGNLTLNFSGTGAIGLTGPPTNGLILRNDILSTDSVTALTDTSGVGNNGTGTEGTPPTIGATGGLICGGAGSTLYPAAINAAKTVALYITKNAPLVGVNESPFAGDGNGTVNNASALLMFGSGAFTGNTQIDQINTYGNGIYGLATWTSFLGTGPIIWTMDTVDHVFFNGVEPTYNTQAASSAGKQTVGVYHLCGNPAGSGLTSGQASRFTGTIWQVFAWNRVLTALEIQQANSFMVNFNAARGKPVSTANSTTVTNNMFLQADSIMGNNNNYTTSAPALAVLNATWNIINHGINGGQAVNYVSIPQYSSNIYFAPSSGRNVMHIGLASNDCSLAVPAATIFQNDSIIAQNWAGLGGKVIWHTMTSRNTFDTCKNAYNLLVRTSAPSTPGWIGTADLGGDTLLGCDGCSLVAANFPDGLHPAQTLVDNNEVPIFQRIVNRANGCQDFSCATSYVAPALAAVATTAGSESTNTVTLTFAATPANCVAGNTILVAGTTPAGYSSALGWLILTRTGTQVTYLANTASMGVITVQGTAVCPQQQDADKYQILNFGAGNYTLESCVGYTGQNIYIKNINAAGSTVVPFSAELIDGAASVAIATRATLALQSILTSAAAGGCSWKQLQNN